MNDEPIDRNPDILGGTPPARESQYAYSWSTWKRAITLTISFRTSRRFPGVKPSRCSKRPGSFSPAIRMRLLLYESMPLPLRTSLPAGADFAR